MCLNAVNSVLVPISGDINSLGGYGMLVDTVNDIRSTTNIKLGILGLFFNNMRLHQALDSYMVNDNREYLGEKLFKTVIRASSLVNQAEMMGKPLGYFRPTSDVYDDFKKLTKEINSRIKKGDN